MIDRFTQLIRPIALGKTGIILPTRIFQGPMEGVTEGSYINAMTARNWTKIWWTPFIRISTGIPRKSRLLNRIQPYLSTGLPVIAQIMGTDTEKLTGTAKRLAELGATIVDLNCACPSRNVVSSHAGGFCLKNPSWIAETLQAMREAVGIRCGISVKLRYGYDSPDEFEAIVQAIAKAEPDMTTLHFRTVREGYAPVSNGLERLARARKLLPDIFLVGCGDIFSPDDAKSMVEITGVDGIAPARGLIRNPRLLTDIEQAAKNIPVTPLTETEKILFLHDMQTDNSARCRGYVLQSAIQMLPKDHPFIGALKTPQRGE